MIIQITPSQSPAMPPSKPRRFSYDDCDAALDEFRQGRPERLDAMVARATSRRAADVLLGRTGSNRIAMWAYRKFADAAYDRDEETFKELIAAGLDRIASTHGSTPLHYAVQAYFLPGVALLLATPDIVVDAQEFHHGFTPVHHAARDAHVKICRLLLAAGARPNLQNKNGYTPAHLLAGARTDAKTVKAVRDALVSAGADLRMVTYPGGDTPRDHADMFSPPDIAALFPK